MKHLLLLALALVPIFCDVEIDHGDKLTKSNFGTFRDSLSVGINQEHEGGLYFIKNEDTGVRVRYTKPKPPSDKDVLSYFQTWPENGKNYRYEFSYSNKQTRDEVGEHVKDKDGIESLKVKGSYSYLDSNGNQYIQGYVADKNGFHTKVAFGPKIRFSESGVKSPQPEPIIKKGIDGALLCSLIGGGCRK